MGESFAKLFTNIPISTLGWSMLSPSRGRPGIPEQNPRTDQPHLLYPGCVLCFIESLLFPKISRSKALSKEAEIIRYR